MIETLLEKVELLRAEIKNIPSHGIDELDNSAERTQILLSIRNIKGQLIKMVKNEDPKVVALSKKYLKPEL